MNKRSKIFLLIYVSIGLLGCAVVAFLFHKNRILAKVLGHKYCYRYEIKDGQPVANEVLMVKTEDMARKTIEFYNIKGSATFYGEIKATIIPFTRLDILGYSTDSTIVKVRIVYKSAIRRYFSSTIGYVPIITLHDTLPKNAITEKDYEVQLHIKNRSKDSLDSITSHYKTLEDIKELRKIKISDIKKIEVHCIPFSVNDMLNRTAEDFAAGSKYDEYEMTNYDSIYNFVYSFRKILRANAKEIKLKNAAHFGGITIFYDNHKNIFSSYDRAYVQIGDSVYVNNAEFIRRLQVAARLRQQVDK